MFSKKTLPVETTKTKGERAEGLALAFLQQKGYLIIERNVRFPFGELDMVAWQGKVLVFIEVRQRSSNAFGRPFETVNQKKQARIIKAAQAYLAKIKKKHPICRFDVVSIEGNPPNHQIMLIENAFCTT
jgi:putative endonuclease